MKKVIIFIICLVFLTTSCGDDMVIKGKERKTIGLVNIIVNDPSIMEPKYPDVQYRIVWGNMIWGVILFCTVIAPIYFYGFSMFEPVGELTKTTN